MPKLPSVLLFFALCSAANAQTAPVREGVLSATRLLTVTRLMPANAEAGPDGLVFVFLVSRTADGRYKFAVNETHDLFVSGKSYQESSQSALGRRFEPEMSIHEAAKYAAAHPELAALVAAAAPRSLIVTLALAGPKLRAGDEVTVSLQLGFGRTADKSDTETLVFGTKVPER